MCIQADQFQTAYYQARSLTSNVPTSRSISDPYTYYLRPWAMRCTLRRVHTTPWIRIRCASDPARARSHLMRIRSNRIECGSSQSTSRWFRTGSANKLSSGHMTTLALALAGPSARSYRIRVITVCTCCGADCTTGDFDGGWLER